MATTARQIGIRPRPQTALPRALSRKATPSSGYLCGVWRRTNASIDFFIGGQKRSATWNQGGSADPMLSGRQRSTRGRPTSMSRPNDLAYTPLPLRILAGLAQACQDVKAKLSVEIKTLEQQTPAACRNPSASRTRGWQVIAVYPVRPA